MGQPPPWERLGIERLVQAHMLPFVPLQRVIGPPDERRVGVPVGTPLSLLGCWQAPWGDGSLSLVLPEVAGTPCCAVSMEAHGNTTAPTLPGDGLKPEMECAAQHPSTARLSLRSWGPGPLPGLPQGLAGFPRGAWPC